MIEPVRLVVWDLDETFWLGTLTEGGMTWREEAACIVRELAGRGIVSTICSLKNHAAQVEAILEEQGALAILRPSEHRPGAQKAPAFAADNTIQSASAQRRSFH